MLPVTCPRCFTQNAVNNVRRSLIADLRLQQIVCFVPGAEVTAPPVRY